MSLMSFPSFSGVAPQFSTFFQEQQKMITSQVSRLIYAQFCLTLIEVYKISMHSYEIVEIDMLTSGKI